ncbi:hypothetical protein [Zavarzinella formosa]|uniref:hypothetical protein n=1 Tax=Zavarzinella formosa TaxID=360055 RepID=UPI0002F2ADD0|nr:hypothetical protein [Zavarzinella formosa]
MSQLRAPRNPDSQERARYFERQVPTAFDLAQDREYLTHKFRRHNRMLHGWGICRGVTIKRVPQGPEKGKPDDALKSFLDEVYPLVTESIRYLPPAVKRETGTWLVALPGYVITPVGDEIFLPEPVFLNTAEVLNGALVAYPSSCGSQMNPSSKTPNGEFYLIVEPTESEIRPVRAASSRCGDHAEQMEFSRVKDTMRFRLLEKKPNEPQAPFDGPVWLTQLLGQSNRRSDYVVVGTVRIVEGKINGEPDMAAPPREQFPQDPPANTGGSSAVPPPSRGEPPSVTQQSATPTVALPRAMAQLQDIQALLGAHWDVLKTLHADDILAMPEDRFIASMEKQSQSGSITPADKDKLRIVYRMCKLSAREQK